MSDRQGLRGSVGGRGCQSAGMTAELISLTALVVSCVAFTVAVADWLQLGREAPWEATWGTEGVMVLTRRHYWPVWIEALVNFHGGGVSVANDAAFPAGIMTRGSSVVLVFGRGGRGSAVYVFYRRATVREVLRTRFGRPLPNPYWSWTTMTGTRSWSTPVLFSGMDRAA